LTTAGLVPEGDEFNSRWQRHRKRKRKWFIDPERVEFNFTPSAWKQIMLIHDPWALPTAIQSHAFSVKTKWLWR